MRKVLVTWMIVTLVMLSGYCFASEIALLSESIPWPLKCAANCTSEISLTATPEEAVVYSVRDDVRYGWIPAGAGVDVGVTCALLGRPDNSPLLMIDTDNDESLLDELWLEPVKRGGLRLFQWKVTVAAEYGDGEETAVASYTLSVAAHALETDPEYALFAGGYCSRRGLAELGGEIYAVELATLRSDGRYGDPEDLVIAIDADRDGYVDSLPGSHEAFGPGQNILLDAGEYAVVEVSDDGRLIRFERVGDAAMRPAIGVGCQAPTFTAMGSDGEIFSLVGRSTLATVILFLPSMDERACVDCVVEAQPRRVSDMIDVLSHYPGIARLVVITAEETVDAASLDRLKQTEVPVTLIYDPQVNELYRRSAGLLVLNEELRIVAMDRHWVDLDVAMAFPRGGFAALTAGDVYRILDGVSERGG